MNKLDLFIDSAAPLLERADGRPGFRLDRLEVYNWGTFHKHVWTLRLGGETALLTGDIGSGKSTLVDAITTLLVPPQKIAYNKAAGADARERTLKTYVLGNYKSERSEAGAASRAVTLRDHNAYSVILGHFVNATLAQHVTLAQVFWTKDPQAQPARIYVVADRPLTIGEHFADFGSDIDRLRKRLRGPLRAELYDTFPPYGAALRRRMGIDNEQALNLFYQTVSMKSVGNLTDFVREHMLEAFPVEPRIGALIRHFDDLNSAHEAVLKAKRQIELLTPIVADCDKHAELLSQVHDLVACRNLLQPWFAMLKADLLDKRLAGLDNDATRLGARITGLSEKQREGQAARDEVKRAIAENGGNRIEKLKCEIVDKQGERTKRAARAGEYGRLAQELGLSPASSLDAFLANRDAIASEREKAAARQAEEQNALTEASVELRELKAQHDDLNAELQSLRQRRSNIPRDMLALRDRLCQATGIEAMAIPFAGELIQVRADDSDWKGAAERLLHAFGLSLLVHDAHYAHVAEWVDRTHLSGRIIYYRVRGASARAQASHPQALARKLAVKPDSPFYDWLDTELGRRFDHACCTTLDQFHREVRAVTRGGQIKGGGERHEKDDRHRIDDASRYVLGWSNEEKIASIEKQLHDLEQRMQKAASRIARCQGEMAALAERINRLQALAHYGHFEDLDWRPLALDIDRLERERRELEQASDILRTLGLQLAEIENALARTESDLKEADHERVRVEERRKRAQELLEDCKALIAVIAGDALAALAPRLNAMRSDALGEHTLTVESCDNRERDMRDWLQAKIDAENKKIERLREKVVSAMRVYCDAYPLETNEVDASLDAEGEFRAMLARLADDDLPKFEARFKELLNENTIREVANFQSQLARERQSIRERIASINRSLHEIEYNPGRYIVLVDDLTVDAEVRDFQSDLRACTEGALTGSEDEAYSEAKFLQVRRIIERFRGRDGTAELDARWTRKVTDVRNWFVFSGSERWREDDREHEHYTDSGGKSGGQKEKLAYTVLAASLAYQFGLEAGASRGRSFRFVTIDEAFGRGSDESARYGLELFRRLGLQLLIVTPLQKIHVIEPYVAAVGFVHSEDGRLSMLRNLTIEEYRAERAARKA